MTHPIGYDYKQELMSHPKGGEGVSNHVQWHTGT